MVEQFSRRYPRLTGWLKFATVIIVGGVGFEATATLTGGWSW